MSNLIPTSHHRKRIVWALSLLLVALGIWFAYELYDGLTRIEEGENLSHVSWLPQTASKVSFHRSYSFTAYEFDISEADFLALAKDEGYAVKPIGGKPVVILRYTFPHANRGPTPPTTDPAQLAADPDERAQRYAAAEKTIRRGYCYEQSHRNGGGTAFAYDADEGRAYFRYSPR